MKKQSNQHKSTKHKISTLLRIILAGTATLVGIISFICMISVNPDLDGWVMLEFTCLGVFLLSFVVGSIADDPNRLWRHLVAIFACISAFAYRRLRVHNDFTYYCNRKRRQLDGYFDLYLFALDTYDDNMYIEYDAISNEEYYE